MTSLAIIMENDLQLLPTPVAGDPNGSEDLDSWERRRQQNLAKGINGDGQGTPLGVAVRMLPTPQASDHKGSGMAMDRGKGYLSDLPEAILLLPTPQAHLGSNGGAQPPEKRIAGGHAPTLADEAEFLPRGNWGVYEDAIQRWEQVMGREAPNPTELTSRGSARLSPKFVEWMMGLPEGWVSDVHLTRAAMLKILGNGVVPQQIALALKDLA